MKKVPDMTTAEIALVEDIAALGKIYVDCRASYNGVYLISDWGAVKVDALDALNFARFYAAKQILQKIRDYAADINKEMEGD